MIVKWIYCNVLLIFIFTSVWKFTKMRETTKCCYTVVFNVLMLFTNLVYNCPQVVTGVWIVNNGVITGYYGDNIIYEVRHIVMC